MLAHATADALLGAAGLDDIGQQFPDTDSSFSNANSMDLLKNVVQLLNDEGWEVCNVDCNVILEEPKLSLYKNNIQDRMSKLLNAPVAVKGRSSEGMGFIGKKEGAACLVVALISKS